MCGCLSRRASQSGVLQKATGGTGGALDPIIGFFFWIRVKILHLVSTKILPYLHYNMPDSSKLPNPHKCVVLGGVPV